MDLSSFIPSPANITTEDILRRIRQEAETAVQNHPDMSYEDAFAIFVHKVLLCLQRGDGYESHIYDSLVEATMNTLSFESNGIQDRSEVIDQTVIMRLLLPIESYKKCRPMCSEVVFPSHTK